jgi:hypothetical protein
MVYKLWSVRKSGLDFDTVIVTSMNEGKFQLENPKILSFRMM